MSKAALQFVDPDRLYTRAAFLVAANLGDTTLRLARRQFGLEPATIIVGRQSYIRGVDGIEFIQRLAEAQSETAQVTEAGV